MSSSGDITMCVVQAMHLHPHQLPRHSGDGSSMRQNRIDGIRRMAGIHSTHPFTGFLEGDMMGASVVSRKPHASMRAAYSMLILTLVLVSLPGMAEEGDEEGEDTRSPAGAIELPVIEVIATTPLPALGTPIDKVPANVQSLTAEDVEEQNPLDLSETLFDNIGTVNINAAQNNPFQNDLEYRAFLASPLVGSAIGLSLYMDGVRINEGFGDTVNWDLIPQSAISSVGSHPGLESALRLEYPGRGDRAPH